MEIMKIKAWKENDGKNEKEADTTDALSLVVNIANSDPHAPKGIEHFRFMRRISTAFDEAKKSKILELDEADYDKLKGLVENHIPANLGTNPDIVKTIEEFLEAKSKKGGT